MKKCPFCEETTRQNRAGKTKAGSQRYRCMHCGHKYTPEPKTQGYPESMRKRATELYVDGNNLRRIARHLKVAPQTVAYWVTDVAEALPSLLRRDASLCHQEGSSGNLGGITQL